MGDDAAFEAALRAALSKLIAVKPRACVEPPRASKLARCASVASYCANFGCRAVRVVATSTGRGLEATRPLAADEFLFAERPVLAIDDAVAEEGAVVVDAPAARSSARRWRAELRASFHFVCACARCAADDGPPPKRRRAV